MRRFQKFEVALGILSVAMFFVFFSLCFYPVRELLISVTEKSVTGRVLNHPHWHSVMIDLSQKGFFALISLILLSVFSHFFVEKCSNSFMNLVRVCACLMVYFLHVSIFTNQRGTLFTNNFIKLFMTPAWGGYTFL